MILQPVQNWSVSLLDEGLSRDEMDAWIHKKMNSFMGKKGAMPGRKRIKQDPPKRKRPWSSRGVFYLMRSESICKRLVLIYGVDASVIDF